MAPVQGIGSYRILKGETIDMVATSQMAATLFWAVRILYDDGSSETLQGDPQITPADNAEHVYTGNDHSKQNGWITNAVVNGSVVGVRGQTLVRLTLGPMNGVTLCQGYIYPSHAVVLGDSIEPIGRAPATWVFQGTVQEDATAGTHICSLTVSPGAGNEMQMLYGSIKAGNTATAQVPSVTINDGTNYLTRFMDVLSCTTANVVFNFPYTGAGSATGMAANVVSPIIVSGTQQLVLQVSTTAVSVTQTFAVVCRVYGAPPSATLADTVGTPTLTTNTNAIF